MLRLRFDVVGSDSEDPGDTSADAIAWICEEVGSAPFPEDGHGDPIAPARFSAHVERGTDTEWGLEWAPLDEALAWARERAPRVIVRIDDGSHGQHYTAGRFPVVWESDDEEEDDDEDDDGDPRTLLPWPEGGLDLRPRRLGGWEFLDRPADAPVISWDTLTVITIDPVPHAVEVTISAQLRRDERVQFVETSLELPRRSPTNREGRFRQYGDAELKVALRLDARTHTEANSIATRACADALAGTIEDPDGPNAGRKLEWESDAYPTGAPVARNARISRQ